MDSETARRARRRLLEERERLRELRERMEAGQLDESAGASIAELSTYDNHPGDIGTETFERGKDIALVQLVDRRITLIDDALEAFDRGTYGVCVSCGASIPEERLEAAPETTLCVNCRSDLEEGRWGGSERPVEEDVLKPAFDRTFTEDDPDQPVIYDGEDSWQEVARYGTSNTPSDIPGARRVEEAFVGSNEQQNVVQRAEAVYRDEEDEEDGRARARPEEPSL